MIIMAGTSSCESYLDVEPKSSLSEDDLFSSALGFEQAATGVYAKMAAKAMYGDNMSLGFVSALAQNYATEGTSAPLVQTRAYNYASAEVIAITNDIWKESYNQIAAVNKVLENTQKNAGLLTEAQRKHYQGEALTLRAYLHFDLLRIFGKSVVFGADRKAIPYKTAVDEKPTPASTTRQVLDFIIKDLNDAAVLLKDDTVDYTLLSSRFTVNYYAAKALQARVYLYSGDNANAYTAANEVVASKKYSFIPVSSVSAAADYRDRLFTTELIFALRARDINTWAQNYFHFYLGSAGNSLTRPEKDINTIYELTAGGSTDIRKLYLFALDGGALYPSKFWQTSQSTAKETRLDQIVPLIRLSEMYYILAETAGDAAKGVPFLNTVLSSRNVNRVLNPAAITPEAFRTELTKEQQKEFYAEGQMFFYYKRLNAASINFYASPLTGDTYVLPIPDSEKEFNPSYD